MSGRLEERYHTLKNSTEQFAQTLDRIAATKASDNQLCQQHTLLEQGIQEMMILAADQPKDKKDSWIRRINVLHQEVGSLKKSLEKVLATRRKLDLATKQRESLKLEQSLAHGDGMTTLASERESLLQSQKEIRTMTSESFEVLRALQNQRNTLGNTQGSLGKIGESLGLSAQIIKNIVRTHKIDAWIVYAGIFFMICFLVGLWYFI
eukprot:PhF_6_TR41010/c0_g1_i2/m.62119/K08496/GOSR2, BOS1; golgi SNAP receptor complex member 2